MEKQYSVSVIVPVFKVEKFIARSCRSLFGQTLDDIQYIFVDDASPDSSMDIVRQSLEEFPERAGDTVFLVHEKNKGLPGARNTGLAAATGKYIYHCDSDDFVEKDMLEKLFLTAEKEEADFLWCDWYLSYEKNERRMQMPDYKTPEEAVSAMLCGGMKYNVWNKLVSRELYSKHQICFPEGFGMGEDMTMILLALHAHKTAHVPEAFYHYVKLNTEAFSQTYSDRHLIELKHNADRIISYFVENTDRRFSEEIGLFKLEVKFPFLITDDSRKYKLWTEWYPEADIYIGRNPYCSKRSNFIQKCAAKRLFLLLKCYYVIVYKIVYRLMYH